MTAWPDEAKQLCLFRLATERFALPLDSVDEIVPMAALSRPPSMPSILEGILNLGGVGVPVLRTARLLGLPPSALGLYTPLIVVSDGQSRIALLVDEILGIQSVSGTSRARLEPASSFNGCVDGSLTVGGNAFHQLSLARLLLERERRAVAEFQGVEALRLRELAASAP